MIVFNCVKWAITRDVVQLKQTGCEGVLREESQCDGYLQRSYIDV